MIVEQRWFLFSFVAFQFFFKFLSWEALFLLEKHNQTLQDTEDTKQSDMWGSRVLEFGLLRTHAYNVQGFLARTGQKPGIQSRWESPGTVENWVIQLGGCRHRENKRIQDWHSLFLFIFLWHLTVVTWSTHTDSVPRTIHLCPLPASKNKWKEQLQRLKGG